MVGLPYTKYMNSNNDVDMAAAVIMCSAEKAESLGVPRDRWVFVHAGTDCHEHQFVSNRWSFAETPAIELGGRRVLELAGCAIDDVALIDLYSCFPSAVQLGAQSLGLSLDRQLTRTGGLSFAGGPWNNYVMHAIATMVADLRTAAGRTWPGVGQRRLRDEALVRRLLDRAATTDSATTTRRPRSTPCRSREFADSGRCRGAGDDRGLHRDALPRRRARDRDRRLPAGRRSTGLGHVDRTRSGRGDVRRRMGRHASPSRLRER